MKLATLHDGSRDGLLAVVSRDLTRAHHAHGIAATLRQLLDDWNFLSPQLEDLYATLNDGKARHAFDFDPRRCLAPLPRAALVAVAGGASEGGDAPAAPTLRAGDALAGPGSAVPAGPGAPTLAPALGLLTGDIAAGTGPGAALDGVRLLALAALWTQPGVAAALQPPPVCGPVAVTPDELGPAWQAGRLKGAALWCGAHEDGPHGRAAASGLPSPPALPAAGEALALLCRHRGIGAGGLLLLPAPAGGVGGAVWLAAADGSQPLGRLDLGGAAPTAS